MFWLGGVNSWRFSFRFSYFKCCTSKQALAKKKKTAILLSADHFWTRCIKSEPKLIRRIDKNIRVRDISLYISEFLSDLNKTFGIVCFTFSNNWFPTKCSLNGGVIICAALLFWQLSTLIDRSKPESVNLEIGAHKAAFNYKLIAVVSKRILKCTMRCSQIIITCY